MNDAVDYTDENPGEIHIKIGDFISVETNLNRALVNYWLDKTKDLILSDETQPTDV